MSTMLGRARVVTPVLLILVGAVVGSTFLAPVMARVGGASTDGDAVVTTTYTRSASCAGLDFYPTDSDTNYANDNTARTRPASYRQDGRYGTGVFRCDPGLPTGAVVRKVQFTLVDHDNFWAVDGCNLRRSGLTVAGAPTVVTLASVGSTGDSEMPGVVRYTDTTIDFATIGNANYGYWFECHLPHDITTPALGIYGADVIYSISAANG